MPVEQKNIKLPRNKAEIEASYAEILAPFATKFPKEGSRAIDEDATIDNRGAFQRDRDRILHTKAFRKLMYKTQVFVNHEGDHFRTRLTHTLEVSQFARGICKSLALNEDLAESIALGHDLGHTPFGHAVEEYFRMKFKSEHIPEFSHNIHSVRVVDYLEKRRKDKDGLNLTCEVREGILKHNSDRNGEYQELNPELPCSSLEGQVVAIVDTVAYICHDLEDGIRSGIIENARENNPDIDQAFHELVEITKDRTTINITTGKYGETFFIRELIHYFIQALTNHSCKVLTDYEIATLDDVQKFALKNETLIRFSGEDDKFFKKLKKIVYKNIYGSQTVKTMDKKAVELIDKLFEAYKREPQLMPPEWFYRHEHRPSGENSAITICDYISSMTDRSALDEYERMFNPSIKI